MKVQFKTRAQQAGFTLIELIVVIVILGIMAATALPKFADLGADARVAKMQAAVAAMKATSATAHAASLAQNNKAGTVKLEGDATPITLQGGYVKAADMQAAAGLTDYAPIDEETPDATVLTLAADSEHPTCKVTYTEAAADGSTVGIISAAPSAADCD